MGAGFQVPGVGRSARERGPIPSSGRERDLKPVRFDSASNPLTPDTRHPTPLIRISP